jgi:hypothetical protein
MVIVMVSVPSILCAQTELLGKREFEQLQWGGVEYRWDRVTVHGDRVNLYRMENVRMVDGPDGRYDVILRDNSPEYMGDTELLLHFDHATRTYVFEDAAHYDMGDVHIFPSHAIEKHGQRSAGFLRYGNLIEIKPRISSVFFDEVPLQSFTIDFHLYPTNVHDSVVVLSWYAPTVDAEQGFSGMRAYFSNGRLHWEFGNVFHEVTSGFDEDQASVREAPHTIVIGELDPTPLNEWHHHAINYDARSGLITLYFDGKESNLLWTTASGHEDGNHLEGRFSRHIGVPMTLGDYFLGYIDEFRISRGTWNYIPGEYIVSRRVKGLSGGDGFIMSDVIDLRNRGTRVVKVLWKSEEDNGTAVRVFVRSSNHYFAPDSEPPPNDNIRDVIAWRKVLAPLQWVPVRNDEDIPEENLKGRYLQWMVVLFGTYGLYTPTLQNLTVVYEPDAPPTRPILLAADPVTDGIRLKWVRNKEHDLKGYRIYFGNRSGYYIENEPKFVPVDTRESRPDSAVKCTESRDTRVCVLDGLENEEVYFISITAVDMEDQESEFSRELIARPSTLFGRAD